MESPLLSVPAVHIFCLFPCYCLLLNSDLLLTSTQLAPSSARHTGRVLHARPNKNGYHLSCKSENRTKLPVHSSALEGKLPTTRPDSCIPGKPPSGSKLPLRSAPDGCLDSLLPHSLASLVWPTRIETQDDLYRPNNPLHHRLFSCQLCLRTRLTAPRH